MWFVKGTKISVSHNTAGVSLILGEGAITHVGGPDCMTLDEYLALNLDLEAKIQGFPLFNRRAKKDEKEDSK